MSIRVLKKVVECLPRLVTLAACSISAQAFAQGDYYGSNSYQEPYVSIYEHCNFKGERRDIAIGEFYRMRELDFDNDSISSIQVPKELEVTIYEHDKFKGDYAKIGRDVRCFDRQWNDQVSSLRVTESSVRRGPRSDGQSPVYGGRNDGRYSSAGTAVTGLNIKHVAFNGRLIQQAGDQVWQEHDAYNGTVRYTEIRRSRQSLVLKNQYNNERIRLDLTANKAFVSGSGKLKSYGIDSRLATVTPVQPNNNHAPVRQSLPDTRIASQCFNYRIYTDGEAGSLRLSNSKDLIRFDGRGYEGRVCHQGELVLAFGKRNFNTNVTMEVNGRLFKFAAGEKETEYRASWYRKTLKLQVGR